MPTKQKTNARSSTEAELIAVDDAIAKIFWSRSLLKAQGFDVKVNIIYQDNNTSTMNLEVNRKGSSGKCIPHFNIKLFNVIDLVENKIVMIEYCPTDDMLADFFTKPLVESKFEDFWARLMNLPNIH